MTITTIIIESDDPVPDYPSNVLIRVFDTNGLFVTSGLSDDGGEVVLDLPDNEYDLYFFKSGVSFFGGMPQRILVDADDEDDPANTYKVIAHILSLPESLDDTLCKVSGFVRGIDGRPTRDSKIVLEMVKEIGVIDGKLIAPMSQLSVIPDKDGYYEFNLLRGVKYKAYFYMLEKLLSSEPPALDIVVPSAPAIRIVDLLFPIPLSASFSVSSLSINVGDPPNDSVEHTLYYSDGSTSQDRAIPRFTSVSSHSDNEEVATVETQEGFVRILAIAPGTANITFSRSISDQLIYDPVPDFVTDILTVTVS